MTAQKDVEQMRWCHIRSMENTQIVDSENLNLRRIIVDLRRRNAEVEGTLSNCIKLLREEISQLRMIHSQECAHTNMSFEVMKKATAKFLDMACDKQNRISALCDANDVVSQSLSDLTASNLQEKVRRQKALTNSESKILKLRDSLIVIETDNSKLMKENDDSKDSMIQLSSKNDVLVAECVRLKAKNAKTETDCDASVVDAVKNQNVLKIACDEYILRNKELEKQNTDLHNQLSKLRADLAAKGNVSNFAKFVEIKSENSFLKSQLESVKKFNASCKKGTRISKPTVHPLLGSSSTLVRGLEKGKCMIKQINNSNNNNDYAGYVNKGRTHWEPGHDHESEERNKYLYVAEKNMTGAKTFFGSKIPAINSDAVDSAIDHETLSKRHSAPHETVRDAATDITLSPRFCSRSINSRWDDVTPFKDALASNTTSNQYTMHGMSSSWSDRGGFKNSGGVGSTDRLTVLDAMNDDTSHTSKIQE